MADILVILGVDSHLGFSYRTDVISVADILVVHAGNHDGSVGMATKLWDGQQGENILPFSITPSLLYHGYRGPFPRV
jgi:hypothetical protein